MLELKPFCSYVWGKLIFCFKVYNYWFMKAHASCEMQQSHFLDSHINWCQADMAVPPQSWVCNDSLQQHSLNHSMMKLYSDCKNDSVTVPRKTSFSQLILLTHCHLK